MSQVVTIPMGFSNATLIQEKGIILVDTGAPATLDKYKEVFTRLQVDPQDVQLIVILTVIPTILATHRSSGI